MDGGLGDAAFLDEAVHGIPNEEVDSLAARSFRG
jgi:hypothetical protein